MKHILVLDHKTKRFTKFIHLREITEMHITKNINKMIDAGYSVSISDANPGGPQFELIKQGWVEDDGAYDRLILDYNQINNPPLSRWKNS
ncbi:hypothetical protein [Flaviaesturariibacter aridisoli]|uniref:Uncharacterized protein n=1 Tax=Flaviaesturariibacter aridisoli TaxID=2545761 RepID=A0A4R4E445_9BACT|nr:hypothetical protein [Flaviaesturariibacter aridisoli]TCZ73460.1 hypothetical protein E0486_05735 [Flaviaesturariibacter aridisoli]